MASKRALKARAESLASELGESVDLSGLDRDGLAEIVEGLERRASERVAAAQEADTQPTGQPPPEAPQSPPASAATAQVAAQDGTRKVAPGKSITSPRGILSEGQTVTLKDFTGSEDARREAMDRLVKSGALV